MTDLSAAEIAEARSDLEAELLPDQATILRRVSEEDGGGGFIDTEWQARETVACRLDPYGSPLSSRGAGGEAAAHPAERLETRTSHFVTLPAETDIELSDRLEINGTTYEITYLRKRGQWELTRRVECKEKT